MSYFYGTMIVNLCQFSQPLREALPAPLTEVRHDVLYEAVSIFLLVRQQLQRINQMSAKALRYCMRPEDLGPVNTFACLHHQEPVWLFPIIFFLHRSHTTIPRLSFPLSTFQGEKAMFHHSVRAVSFIASFHLLQELPGWRCQLPLILYSCLHFFFSLLSKPSYSLNLSWQKIFPHFSHVLFCSHHILPDLPRCAFFSTNSSHRHFVNSLSPVASTDSL